MSRIPSFLRPSRRLAAAFLAALPALAALGTGAPSPAVAQIGDLPAPVALSLEEEEEIEVPSFLWGVTAHGRVGAMAMNEIGDAISELNRVLGEQGTVGTEYDRPRSAPSFGLGLRAVLLDRVLLAAEYERLIQSQQIGGVAVETAHAELDLTAQSYTFSAAWDFLSDPYQKFGFGVGLTYWKSLAEHQLTANDTLSATISLDGSDLGQNYFTYIEVPLTERFYAIFEAGYRVAKIEQLEIGGLGSLLEGKATLPEWGDFRLEEIVERVEVTPAIPGQDGEPDTPAVTRDQLRAGGDTLDYSGFYGRLGFTLYWNPPDRF